MGEVEKHGTEPEEEPTGEELPAGVVVASEPAPRRRRRWPRWTRRALGGLLLAVLVAVGLLLQTGAGQRLVVDQLLDRVRGSLAGDLIVGDVRSGTLLLGMTLIDVRLDAAEGRRFLEADSVVVRYSPLSFLVGAPRVQAATVHRLGLEISRHPGDEFTNLDRILRDEGQAEPAPATAPSTIQLGRIGVRGGTVEILTPGDAGATEMTVPGPGGTHLRRLAFEAVDVDLEDAVLRPGGSVAFDARLASLSASAFVLEQPLVIHEAFGEVTFGAMGLEIQEAAFRLPGSLIEGDVRFGPESPKDPWTFRADVGTEGWGDLSDLAWLDARIPAGRFRGTASLHVEDGIDVELTDMEAQVAASTVVANGRARFGDILSMRSLEVTASPLAVSQLEPWLDRDIPVDGFLSGQAIFGGTTQDVQATGRMTLVPTGMGGVSTTVDFSGTLHRGDNPGATDLEVRFDPLNYRLLEAVWPAAGRLAAGSGTIQVNGRAEQGLLVVADLTHVSDSLSTSRAVGRGLVRLTEEEEWVTDIRGALAPLSLAMLNRIWPDADLRGSVEGPVRLNGPLGDLAVTGDLSAGDGRLVLNGALDATSIGSRYRLDAELQAVELSELTGALPEPSVLSGLVTVDGSGRRPDSLEGVAEVAVRSSRVGGVRIDSLTAAFRAGDGVLAADTVDAYVSGVHVSGGGGLGMVEGATGNAYFEFASESLLELRPALMGDSILVRDGLNPLEEDLLRVRGIEPDTLPTEQDVRMEGSARGTASLSGRFRDLEAVVAFELSEAAYGHNEVDSARVSLVAAGLPGTLGAWDVDVGARGIVWEGRRFDEVQFDGAMVEQRGGGALDVVRSEAERYSVTGSFALDSLGGQVELAEATVRVDSLEWELGDPAAIAWNETSLSLDTLEITRGDADPMRLTAGGRLARGGDSSFRLDVQGFHVEHAMRILQREDIDVAGHIDLSLTIGGGTEQPVINALFQVDQPRYGPFELTRLGGSLEYADQSAALRVDAWDGQRNALTVFGTLPVDLALEEVERRNVIAPMDLRLSADSLDAAIALSYLTTLEDVVGTISADVRVQGTTESIEPSGSVYLEDAAWTLEALGVRHTGVTGELLSRPDRTVAVKLGTTRTGTSTVTGMVTLDTLSNPALDLVVAFDRFQSVARRDMESTISGEFNVRGRYRLPVAEGTLTVDEGTLFVEEFARTAGVVDLRDPLLYADGLSVDTTVFVSQPLIAGLRNPFLDNLRVDIDMVVARDMWLRSDDMNVEMGGELDLRYDRRQGDLVLVGELQALRGSYLVLGRTFEVDGGSVSFLGQPGVNPNLDIQASSRVRRLEGERLEINAVVEGTLVEPLVTLSTEEAGLAQSDLISYLLFGRASSELGRDPTGGGAGFGQNLRSGVGTYVAGTLANQVGAALAQNIGLDYLAVSQAAALGDADFARDTQLEVGSYLGEDVFVVLVFSTPSERAAGDEGGVNPVRGVRVEVAVTEDWFVEGFIEDRFLRSGTAGLGAAGLDGDQVIGAFVFREWGYGGPQDQDQE